MTTHLGSDWNLINDSHFIWEENIYPKFKQLKFVLCNSRWSVYEIIIKKKTLPVPYIKKDILFSRSQGKTIDYTCVPVV